MTVIFPTLKDNTNSDNIKKRQNNMAKMTHALRLATLTAGAVLVMALGSCRTPRDITYFHELQAGDRNEITTPRDITVRPDDRISIVVSSKDPKLAAMFNLPIVSQRAGQPGITAGSGSGSNDVASYVVDAYGDIQFPIIGTVHVGGMRRAEVAESIRSELLNRDLLKDPVVVVDFLNHGVSVLGEVSKPGRVNFDRDRFTLLDAIAGAGDLTIQGKRTDVLVLRQEDGRQVAYRVDLTKGTELAQSPVFYLQQDDVVYVSPNDVRKRQTTANGSTPLTPGFWISIASLLTTVAVLIWK